MSVTHSQPGRLGSIFDACRAEGRAALIGYLPTGYPDLPTSLISCVSSLESRVRCLESELSQTRGASRTR